MPYRDTHMHAFEKILYQFSIMISTHLLNERIATIHDRYHNSLLYPVMFANCSFNPFPPVYVDVFLCRIMNTKLSLYQNAFSFCTIPSMVYHVFAISLPGGTPPTIWETPFSCMPVLVHMQTSIRATKCYLKINAHNACTFIGIFT